MFGVVVPRGRIVAYLSGVVLLALALLSPLDTLGREYLLTARVAQILIIVTFVAPLLMIGLPDELAQRLLPVRSWREAAGTPLFVVIMVLAFNTIVLFWQIPRYYDLAAQNTLWHNVANLSYLLAGVALVLALLQRSWAPIARAVVGVTLGLGLSALYLVPAAVEQKWVQIRQATDDPGMAIENSFLFGRHADPNLELHDVELWRVSIIAVFLALALGIVVGTTALNGPITSNLRSEVDTLRKDRTSLSSQISTLQGQVSDAAQFATTYGPQIVKGTLTDKSVLIVGLPGADTGLKDRLGKQVGAAGGKVSGRVQLTSDYSDPKRASDLTALATGNAHPVGMLLPNTDDAGVLGSGGAGIRPCRRAGCRLQASGRGRAGPRKRADHWASAD